MGKCSCWNKVSPDLSGKQLRVVLVLKVQRFLVFLCLGRPDCAGERGNLASNSMPVKWEKQRSAQLLESVQAVLRSCWEQGEELPGVQNKGQQ